MAEEVAAKIEKMRKRKIDSLAELRKHVQGKKLIIGTKRVMRSLRSGKLLSVFVASNCSESVKQEAERYCSLAGCYFEQLQMRNEDLGTLCKRPFSVAAVGITK